jgi:hypothetical protein
VTEDGKFKFNLFMKEQYCLPLRDGNNVGGENNMTEKTKIKKLTNLPFSNNRFIVYVEPLY